MSDAIRHIVVLGAQPEWLSGLRGPMLRDFVARGYRVTAIGAEEMPAVRARLESWGVAYEVVPISRAGLNPLADLSTLVALYRKLRALRPDLLFAYTIKPVVYGMPVGWAAGVKRRYAMVPGRGYALLEGREPSRIVSRFVATLLYRFGLRFADGVLFHNEEDIAFFHERRILKPGANTKRIWGSGVDLEHHRPTVMPAIDAGHPVRFLMIGRMKRDKGVREFALAAKAIREAGLPAEFRLVGPTDPSANAIPLEEIEAWESDGTLTHLGALADVRPEIEAAHVVVLPSYAGEGLPRSVLEGMATGRAIITTISPGCSDTVEDGISGCLVPVRDHAALAAAMARFIRDEAFLASAGQRSLALARERFDVDSVNAEIATFLGLVKRRRTESFE